MGRFVETDNGWVNLDHVALVMKGARDPTRGPRHVLYAQDRKSVLGVVTGRDFDIDALSAPAVPAAPETIAYLVWISDEKGRPGERNVMSDAVPVVAWLLTQPFLTPIMLEEAPSNTTVLLTLPGGRLLHPYIQEFDNLDAAKASFLREAQEEWDRRLKEADGL